MLKLFSHTELATDNASDDGIWDLKCWLAIALFGLLLTMSDTNRFLQQAGKSVALLAGGGAAATLIHKNEDRTDSEQLVLKLQSEKAMQAAELVAMEQQEQQLLGELYEVAIAESTLFASTTESDTTSRIKIEQAQARIKELETALADKTALATEMLTELEAEATSTFNQFNAKIAAQDNLINNLHRQIESLRAANAALTTTQSANQLLTSMGPDSPQSQQRLHHLLRN